MAVLSWGKCTLEHVVSENGAPKGGGSASWKALPTPKENTTKITPSAGTQKTATEEGGGLVDIRYSKNTYTLEFDLFVKKGKNARLKMMMVSFQENTRSESLLRMKDVRVHKLTVLFFVVMNLTPQKKEKCCTMLLNA